MAVTDNVTLERIAFTQDPAFGNVQPEGYAAGRSTITGDGAGNLTAVFLSPGGFLFRPELLQTQRNDQAAAEVRLTLGHSWLSESLSFGTGVFDMEYILTRTLGANNQFHHLLDIPNAKRVPLGVARKISSEGIATFLLTPNTNTIEYTTKVIFSFWRVEAFGRPGFMQAFLETPLFVPGIRG